MPRRHSTTFGWKTADNGDVHPALLLRCSAAQGAAVPSERRHNAADQTPILNEAGEPELFIRCVTEETVEEMMEGVKP